MDNIRTPDISPAAPLDGIYRYEIIQTEGIGGDKTYYVDIWFIYGVDGIQYDDAYKLKAGDRIMRTKEGEMKVLSAEKPKLRLVVDNE